MADEKKHDHKHCENCEAHRQAEREDLRERLKKCCEAREAARSQRETQMAEELEAAQAEASSLKKKLAAFQLATVVGVTILGQETFDKIMGKVDEVQAVQEKITGGGKSDPKDEKPSPPTPPKSGKPVSWSGDYSNTILVHEPISDAWKIRTPRPSSTLDAPLVVTEPLTPVQVAAAPATDPSGIGLPPITVPPAPWAHNDWSQYIFTNPTPYLAPVAVALNTGVDSGWGDGAGVFVQPAPVPSPNTFSVFALSLVNNGRRRNA